MNRIDINRLAMTVVLFAVCGCGAHGTNLRPPADVMRGAITPVASAPPEGVLSPVGNGSRTAGVAVAPRTAKPVNAAPAREVPATSAPARATSTKSTSTTSKSAKPTSTKYASDRAVRIPAATPTAAPAPVAPAATPPTSAPAATSKSTRLSGPSGFVDVEQLPEANVRVQPVYPPQAREAGVDGTVVLLVLVGADGHVYDVRVVHSIPMLDEAAKTAVKQWKFSPALSAGKSVAVWFEVPVGFTLH